MEVAEKICIIPHRERVQQWANLGEPKERRDLREDGTERLDQRSDVSHIALRPSLPWASLPDRWGRIHQLGDGSDLQCVCPRCWSIYHLTQVRLSHHIDRCGRGSNVCNSELRRVSPSRLIVAAVVVAAAATIVVGRGGLLGICGECGKATATE